MTEKTTPEHCGEPMKFYVVGAPGTGCGWYCEQCSHTTEVRRARIMSYEETR